MSVPRGLIITSTAESTAVARPWIVLCFSLLSTAEKRLAALKEFDSSFDAVVEWLNATTATVQSLAVSVPTSSDDARCLLDASQNCLKELSQKQRDLDCLSAKARALHQGEVSAVYELIARHSLTTKKLKVRN